MNDNFTPHQQALYGAMRLLIADSGIAEMNAGWRHDPQTGDPIPLDVPQKLMLTVSELAEAMEGHRKNLMDDKIPDFPMFTAELADTIIRVLALAHWAEADLAGAYVAKRSFNDNRLDHKREARLAASGKAY